MIFKNLYYNIIIRVILIAATCFLLPFAHKKFQDIIININIVGALIIQVILLIRRLNYLNRDLIAFFDSLKYDDSSILLTNEFQHINYMRLSRRLQTVNNQILKLKEKSARENQYFQTITELANVGLLSFNEKGSVKLANKALKDLFKLNNIVNIKELNVFHPNFAEILKTLSPTEHKLIKITLSNNANKELLQLILRSADFKTQDEKLRIVSIHDIKNELDEKELESWQKLVHTLRHEIMNSIGPISSTIDTLNELITNPDNNQIVQIDHLNNEIISDISSGLKIVKERNIGLQQFVDKFRSISKLPKPNFEKIIIKDLFENIKSFWKNEFENKKIEFKIPEDHLTEHILIDKNQIEQIIINLIKNALEADANSIKMSSTKDKNNQLLITISDNGKGINQEIIDEIFMPFFTTKEQGSGIGLSLARQIMRLHNGNIYVVSSSDSNYTTTFILSF